MKNYIITLLLILGFGLYAQNSKNVNLNTSKYIFSEVGTIKDTVSTVGSDTTFDYVVSIDGNIASTHYYDFGAKVKEKSGSSGVCYIKIGGRKFTTDSYTEIASIKYFGTGGDTTIRFAQVSTKQFYNQYRIRLSRPAATSKTYISEVYGQIKTQ